MAIMRVLTKNGFGFTSVRPGIFRAVHQIEMIKLLIYF